MYASALFASRLSKNTLPAQVMVVQNNGRLAYQSVFMFSHRDATTVSEFVTLRTVSDGQIQMSPSHYVWAAPTSPLHHSPDGGATAAWRSRKNDDGGAAVVSNSFAVAAANSVTVSRRQMLTASKLWDEAFGRSQVFLLTAHPPPSTVTTYIIPGHLPPTKIERRLHVGLKV